MNTQLLLTRMTACVTLALLFGGAAAQDTTASTPKGNTAAPAASKIAAGDQRMMREISFANNSEIAAGKLALEKSQSEDVKAFAQKMIDDHTKAQQELQALAASKGVTLPAEPDAKHKAMAKTLSALKGEAFDKRYLKQGGLDDHHAAHKLLDRVHSRAKDGDLKAYAAKTITAVELHLAMAEETAGKHGVGKTKAPLKGVTSDTGTGSSRSSATSVSGASGTATTGNAAGTGGSSGTSGASSNGPGAATGGTSGGPAR